MYLNYRIKDFYYSIRDFIFPRQFWLIKKLWGGWKDKDTIIEVVLFKCLTEFIETEIGKEELFDKNRWPKNDNLYSHQLKFEEELKDVYLVYTKTIKELENELNNLYDSAANIDKIVEKEKELKEIKTDILVWICRNRNLMWT